MVPARVVKSSAPTITGRAVDQAGAGDDAVGGDVAADQRADLAERARVEQMVDPRAGVELALGALLGQALRRRPSPGCADGAARGRRACPPSPGRSSCTILSSRTVVRRRDASLALTILNCLL